MNRGISDCLSDESFSSEDLNSTKEINFVLPENRTRWETDKKCAACQINFNIPGVAHTEKDTCLFCYRGICRRCITSSKKHPETQKKEKICKLCVVEFRQIRFFSNKIEDSKLELSHLRLEVELAMRENQEMTQQRKYVQAAVENARIIENSTITEKEIKIDEAKTNLSSLNIRHDESEEKLRELGEHIPNLKQKIVESRARINKWKKKIAEKDEEETKLKRQIEDIKRKTIELLHKSQTDSGVIGDVVENVESLKRSYQRYDRRVARKNNEISELEEQLSKLRLSYEENDKEIENLNEKIANLQVSSEEEYLKQAQETLNSYDETIEKLTIRLENQKKNLRKSNIATSNKYDRMLRQCELMANVSYAQKNNIHRKESNGSTSCQKCIVS